MCHVSTQITGRPASPSPLKSHWDSGPASRPTRRQSIVGAVSIGIMAAGSDATRVSRTSFPISSTMQMLVCRTETSKPDEDPKIHKQILVQKFYRYQP